MKLGMGDLITMPKLVALVHSMCVLLGREVYITGQSQEFPGDVHAHTCTLGSHYSPQGAFLGQAKETMVYWHQ